MQKLALCLLLLISSHAFSQQLDRIRVKVECSCSDSAGSLYATAFRDALARSPRYIEIQEDTYQYPGQSKKLPAWVLHIVTLDSTVNNDGSSAAIAVTLTLSGIYINTSVQVCGARAAERCAAQALASVDGQITNVIEAAH